MTIISTYLHYREVRMVSQDQGQGKNTDSQKGQNSKAMGNKSRETGITEHICLNFFIDKTEMTTTEQKQI